MGRLVLLARLVAGSLRRRRFEALLTVVAIAAGSTTLALALALYGVTTHPYLTTRAETAGPDIVAMPITGGAPALDALKQLEHAPGLVASSGPYPVTFPVLRVNGFTVLAVAEGRSTGRSSMDQPYVTSGHWVTPGGVVVEQAFADELGVVVGDNVTLNGHPFRVVGIAVTAAVPAYPNTIDGISYDAGGPGVAGFGQGISSDETGLVWLTAADDPSTATALAPVSSMLDLRLANPASAETFENAYAGSQTVSLISWIDVENDDGSLFAPLQRALLIASWLLGLLAAASLAVVVGGRMAEENRRVGLLKAVGGTPRLVALVLLAEYLALAVVAAAIGLAAGWLSAPLISGPGGLVGGAGAPSVTWSTVLWVLAMAIAVAVLAASVPAIRASRTSTTRALADAAHTPKRRALLIAIAARLPVPLLLGLRLAARRPRRMVLTTCSLALTVTTIVALLAVHAHQGQQLAAGFLPSGYSAVPNPRFARDDQVIDVITIVLGVLAAVNAIVITWATSIDSRRPLAIARASGASPRQVGTGLTAALLLPAVPGALAGVPLGLLLVEATNHGQRLAVPPAWWLVAAVLGTLLAIAALSAVPARLGARRPVAPILQSEGG